MISGPSIKVGTYAIGHQIIWAVSRLVHLGSARFFTTDMLGPYPAGHAVFTAVEVERCAATDGGLRMVKHGSLYMLLHEMQMIPWVL